MSTAAPQRSKPQTGHTSRLLHLYGCHIATGRPPGIGDKALCGYTRTTPPNEGMPFERTPDACVVCLALRDGAAVVTSLSKLASAHIYRAATRAGLAPPSPLANLGACSSSQAPRAGAHRAVKPARRPTLSDRIFRRVLSRTFGPECAYSELASAAIASAILTTVAEDLG